jgi:transcriptional regulator with XRE-family HTH domain
LHEGGASVDYSLLGKRIREERLRLNLTQEKLAEDINISTAYLGQIERGERSVTLEKLIPLANRLGVTVDFLLADYITPDSDVSLNQLAQLLHDKTDAEKEMAVNVVKLMFSYTDGKI